LPRLREERNFSVREAGLRIGAYKAIGERLMLLDLELDPLERSGVGGKRLTWGGGHLKFLGIVVIQTFVPRRVKPRKNGVN